MLLPSSKRIYTSGYFLVRFMLFWNTFKGHLPSPHHTQTFPPHTNCCISQSQAKAQFKCICIIFGEKFKSIPSSFSFLPRWKNQRKTIRKRLVTKSAEFAFKLRLWSLLHVRAHGCMCCSSTNWPCRNVSVAAAWRRGRESPADSPRVGLTCCFFFF